MVRRSLLCREHDDRTVAMCALATQTPSSVSRDGASASISTTSGAWRAIRVDRSAAGMTSATILTPPCSRVLRSSAMRPSPSSMKHHPEHVPFLPRSHAMQDVCHFGNDRCARRAPAAMAGRAGHGRAPHRGCTTHSLLRTAMARSDAALHHLAAQRGPDSPWMPRGPGRSPGGQLIHMGISAPRRGWAKLA